MHTTSKERNGTRLPYYINYHLKSEVPITLHFQLCSTYYTAVWIDNSLKSTSAIKVATMNTKDTFCYERKLSCATTKSTFTVSKDQCDTKEKIGKSMKNELYTLKYAKRHLLGRSNVDQWRNQACIALAICDIYKMAYVLVNTLAIVGSFFVIRKWCTLDYFNYILLYHRYKVALQSETDHMSVLTHFGFISLPSGSQFCSINREHTM